MKRQSKKTGSFVWTLLGCLGLLCATAGCGDSAGSVQPPTPPESMDLFPFMPADDGRHVDPIQVSVMPAQWPPSRIGDPIQAYVPDESLQVAEWDSGWQRTRAFDTDGDGEADYWTDERIWQDQELLGSVHFTEADGSRVILWASNQGRVDWEQRWGEDWFENSFDRDDNGWMDDLRRGEGIRLTDWRVLTEESAERQPDRRVSPAPEDVQADELLFPHALLEGGMALRIVFDEEIERADIIARALWSDFVPAIDPLILGNLSGIAVQADWLDAQAEVEIRADQAGFAIRILSGPGGPWQGTTPIIHLQQGDSEPKPVALYCPKALIDDTLNLREKYNQNIETANFLIAEYQTILDQANGYLEDPDSIPTPFDSEIADVLARLNELAAQLDLLRPEMFVLWDDSPVEIQRQAVELVLAGELGEDERVIIENLQDQLISGPVPSDQIEAEIADIVLAGMLRALDQSDAAFLQLVLEHRDLVNYTLPGLEQNAADHRDHRLGYYAERKEYAEAGLADATQMLEEAEAGLLELSIRPSVWEGVTGHQPYTY